MRYIVQLGLFTISNDRIFCFKLLKRLDTSMTSNETFRAMITAAKASHDRVMIGHDGVMQASLQASKPNKQANKGERKKSDKQKEDKKQYGTEGLVYLSDNEYAKLLEKYGQQLLDKFIEKLDSYKQSSGHKYASDAGAMRSWVIDEVIKASPPQAQPIKKFDVSKEYSSAYDMEALKRENDAKWALAAENKRKIEERERMNVQHG